MHTEYGKENTRSRFGVVWKTRSVLLTEILTSVMLPRLSVLKFNVHISIYLTDIPFDDSEAVNQWNEGTIP